MTRPVRIPAAVLPALALLGAATLAAPAARAAAPDISNAWAPAAEKPGVDVPVFMRIANPGAPDAILRVRCPVANFTEKRIVDYGEGAPSSREVKAIPLPSGDTILKLDASYILLLQTTQPLAAGDHFSCKVAFQSGGSQDVDVTVKAP